MRKELRKNPSVGIVHSTVRMTTTNDATGLLKADRMALRASLPRSTVFTGRSRPPGSGASMMGGVDEVIRWPFACEAA